jgi:hypothetical protein
MRAHAIAPNRAGRSRNERRLPAAATAAGAVPARSAAPAACACGGGCPRCAAQPQVKVSRPGDPLEREADRIAERVARGERAGAVTRAAAAPLQRLSAVESPERGDGDVAPEEEREEIQRLAAAAAAAPPADVGAGLRAAAGGGKALAPQVRGPLEAGIGADFSGVRVHDDGRAAGLCDALHARAFTRGADVFFNRGEYRPDTREGRRVLAHELAHVVQQGAAAGAPAIQRMAALDHTGPDNIAKTGKRPWGGSEPTGNDYYVETDAGSRVVAWVAYAGHAENLRYWCHGYSLGTYGRWMYSVYSGDDLRTVIADEYRSVSPATAQAGDLAVWSAFQHSARFTSVSVSGGALDESASRLDSKNGQAALANYSLAEIVAVRGYGPDYGVYRRR